LLYDVIVVGGGPAGSLTAYWLSTRGHRVLLLEKERYPRYKPCGGGVTMKTLRSLPFDVDPVLELPVAGGIVSYRGETVLQVEPSEPVAGLVMRDTFDHYMVEQAVEAGTELVQGRAVEGVEIEDGQVRVLVEGDAHTARFVVGADGVTSTVASSVGLLADRETGIAVEVEIEVPSEALEALGPYAVFDFGAIERGYGWIFPKSDHLSVGVGQVGQPTVKKLKHLLWSFVDHYPLISDYRPVHLQGHPIPFGGRLSQLHKDRVLLVGDAANLADPWLGEGISYAARSARLAADVLTDALEDGHTDLSSYTERVNHDIVHQFRHARQIGWMVYHAPKACVTLLRRSEWLQRELISTLRGDCTFEQLRRAVMRRSPHLLMDALSNRTKGENNG